MKTILILLAVGLFGKDLPFSFNLDGVESSKFISEWSREECRISDTEYSISLTDPQKALSIRADIKEYTDFDAVEWTLHLTNLSDKPSGRITEWKAIDCSLGRTRNSPVSKLPETNQANATVNNAGTTLFTLLGSDALMEDFSLVKIPIERDSIYHFSPVGGRSSAVSAFPFYNIALDGKHGTFVAIGWSGNWEADFICKKDIRVTAGMPLDLYLLPGESIRSPKILLMDWKGNDRIDGHNKFRRFMLKHFTPRGSDGEIIQPPFCASFDYGDPKPCLENEATTELLCRAVIDRHHRWGIMPEYFWLDAGWYKGNNSPMDSDHANWANTVGNWSADSSRFPGGIKAVSDAAHAAGAKMLLWFEPERVYRGTDWYNEHPEWLLRRELWANNCLLDLGKPEACKFLTDYMIRFFEENGIDCYRQDFNISPDYLWAANDPEGRSGITEIRYIEGLYKFLDGLREHFPDLLIDNCASGGRRLDIEMMTRSIPLWRTDYNFGEPTGQQSHQYGLSQFLPIHGVGIIEFDNYSARSGYTSCICWYGEIFKRGADFTLMKKLFDDYYRLRGFYLKDFYPLCGDGPTTGYDRWLAWQFHDPDTGKGIVTAFRRDEAENDNCTVCLRGLDPNKTYRFRDDDKGNVFLLTGADATRGVKLYLPQKRSSLMMEYEEER